MSASAKTNGGSRSSRLSTISNGQLHEQYKNRYRPLQSNGNGHAHANGSAATSGTSTPLSFLGPRLQLLASDLEERLEAQSEKPGWSGNMARNLLERGMWLEERLENEVDLRTHAIGGIDNMWLLLSSISSFNPVCCATYTFKDGVTREGVEGMLEKQLKLFPKYKQVLRNTGRRWHGSTFVEDPNWDVKRQIFEESLPEPAGRKELDDFVSLSASIPQGRLLTFLSEQTAQFIARPWDFDKPLWETIIFNNYKDEVSGAKGAMIIRGHHTLTDGQGFVMSQLLVSSYGPELDAMLKEGQATLRNARRGKARPSKLHKGLKPLDPYRHTLLVQIVMFCLFWFISLMSSALEILGSGFQAIAFAAGYMANSWRQKYATTEYLGPRVAEKEFSTSLAFPMSDVKKMQKAFSGPKPGGWIERAVGKPAASKMNHLTLNDVLCTVRRLPCLLQIESKLTSSAVPGHCRRHLGRAR